MRISELSVRRPVFATVLSMLLVIFGIVSLQRLSVREYPDIDRPTVSITTAYRGASAAIIETKITQIIEDSVAGIEGILKIESDSEDERSQVRIEFDINRDVDAAANDVRDRIARVLRGLPPEADPPQIVKADANADSVVTLAFSSDTMSMLDLTDYAERNIVDRMSTVPGRRERRHRRRPPLLDARVDRPPGARGPSAHGHRHRGRAAARERRAARRAASSRARASSRCARSSASRASRTSAISSSSAAPTATSCGLARSPTYGSRPRTSAPTAV